MSNPLSYGFSEGVGYSPGCSRNDHYFRSCENSINYFAETEISEEYGRAKSDAPSYSFICRCSNIYTVLSAAITISKPDELDRILHQINIVSDSINWPILGVSPLLASVIFQPSLVPKILEKKETQISHNYKGEMFLVHLIKTSMLYNSKVEETLLLHAVTTNPFLFNQSSFLVEKAIELDLLQVFQFLKKENVPLKNVEFYVIFAFSNEKNDIARFILEMIDENLVQAIDKAVASIHKQLNTFVIEKKVRDDVKDEEQLS